MSSRSNGYSVFGAEQGAVCVQNRQYMLPQEGLRLLHRHTGKLCRVDDGAEFIFRKTEGLVGCDALQEIVFRACQLHGLGGRDAVLTDRLVQRLTVPAFFLTQYIMMFSVAMNGSSSIRSFSAILG